MATFDLPVTHRRSLAFHVALSMALFYLGNAMPDTPVHVKVATPKWDDGSLPEQLSLAIQDDSGWETDVVLTRANIEPNIPVYTYCGGHKGGSDYQLEDLEDNQNVAYYQSVDHNAAIQVTKVDSSGQQSDFLLNGELVVNGTRCSLTHEFKRKRDAASSSPLSSDDVIYNLHELPPIPANYVDYMDIPLHLQEREDLQPPIPEVSSSQDAGSRSGKQDIYIDAAAAVDFAKFSQFKNSYGSRKSALNAMRQYYLAVFNGIDRGFQAITNSPYSIHVRLVKLVIDADSSAPWSLKPFLYQGRQTLHGGGSLQTFAKLVRDDSNFLGKHDTALLFTGFRLYDANQGGSLLGIAYTSTICNRPSVSVAIDTSQSQATHTATHELGHVLSAGHDDDDIRCANGNWMLSLDFKFQFSPCSIESFNTFINTKLQTRGGKCLLEQMPVRNVRSDVSRDLPVNKISLDD